MDKKTDEEIYNEILAEIRTEMKKVSEYAFKSIDDLDGSINKDFDDYRSQIIEAVKTRDAAKIEELKKRIMSANG